MFLAKPVALAGFGLLGFWLAGADVLAILALLPDVVGEGYVAIALGFAVMPAGVGFLVGGVLVLALGSVTPTSFEVESLTVTSRIAKREWLTMCYIVLVAGVLGVILGLTGVFTEIVDWIEGPILSGMMTGVGIILSMVAYDLLKDNKIVGIVSVTAAVLTFLYFSTDENGLIYAIAVSVAAGLVAAQFTKYEHVPVDLSKERIRMIPLDRFRFLRNPVVIRGVLALLALRTGTSIAYTGINSDLASVTPTYDDTNIIVGAGGAASALFGGPPLEPIVVGTASGPNPVNAAGIFMFAAAVVVLFRLLPKFAVYAPVSAISGLLFVIGAMITVPGNIGGVVTEDDPFSGPATMVTTAATFDPFLGIVVGVIVRFFADLFL